MSDGISFTIQDDMLFVNIPEPYQENCYKVIPIMSKEVFIQCYKEWIEKGKIDDTDR